MNDVTGRITVAAQSLVTSARLSLFGAMASSYMARADGRLLALVGSSYRLRPYGGSSQTRKWQGGANKSPSGISGPLSYTAEFFLLTTLRPLPP